MFRNRYNSDKVAEVSYASKPTLQACFQKGSVNMLQLFKAKTAWCRNSAIAPSCLSFPLFAQKYNHPAAAERAYQLSLQRSITQALAPWLVQRTSSQVQTIHPKCVEALRMPSMLVSGMKRIEPLL